MILSANQAREPLHRLADEQETDQRSHTPTTSLLQRAPFGSSHCDESLPNGGLVEIVDCKCYVLVIHEIPWFTEV